MYHAWLDRWDEKRAQLGENGKEVSDFQLGAELGFPGAKNISSISDFCERADQAVVDSMFFDEPPGWTPRFERGEEWIKFPSGISTDVEENNVVWAKVTESGSNNQALVIFHHWNAKKRYRPLANYFARRGITVVEIALPYHFERCRPGAAHADYFLSPNLGRTIQSVKQGVWDGRKLIGWLKSEGYGEISVLGMSLGSWVAALVAAHDSAVTKAALFMTGGSAADVAWTSRATKTVRQSLEPAIDLIDLRRAWGPLNLENYVDRLARPDLDLQVVLAKRDKVVLPEISEKFLKRLIDAGAKPKVLQLNCGHYSLGRPPHILFAGFSLKKLLRIGN